MTWYNRFKYFLPHLLAIFILLVIFAIIYQKKYTSEKQDSQSVAENRQTTPAEIGKIIYVSPQGSDMFGGLTQERAIKSIQRAIDLARPGDTVTLMPGLYLQDAITKRSGTSAGPITITGPKEAKVMGGGRARIFEINHDYITLDGFTIDGLHGDTGSAKGYRDKLIYAVSKSAGKGVTEVKILNMVVKNAGGECIRLRYFAKQNEVAYNTIGRCGVFDFTLSGGGKNGEGIYVGTAPEKLKDGRSPTEDRDESNNNWIHHNSIDTQGNECVDIKEGSSGNIVEYNNCTGQKDPESGGLDARGSGNIFRYNEIHGNIGAGVRLGGDKKTDGIDNDVYGNIIQSNASGGVKIQRTPQGKICDNKLEGNSKGDSVGSYGEDFNPTVSCS